uniref:Putative chitinase n=3 Tax=Crangon crangon TaxID=491138 RepID=A0A2Z4BYH7_CRACN|nr:putative chitinase [Crangon crangon]
MKVLGLLLVLTVGVSTAEKIVCYFSSWAVYRPDQGKFDVEDIDPFLCTHFIFSFAGLSNHTWEIEVLDPWNELCPWETGGNHCAYQRFVDQKWTNPDLTLLLALGGWNEGSEDYSVMAADPTKRKTFIDSCIALLHTQHFDGMDFDWEYPAARGGKPEDKENYVTLMQEMFLAFKAATPRLMLTAAMPAGKPTIDTGYDITALIPIVDQFHIMAYDYHGSFEDHTHHNAPLCGYKEDTGNDTYFNIDYTVNYYLDLGMPKDKMILGTPMYGRCYVLDNIEDHGMLAPAHLPGPPGPYLRIPGTLAANEICLRLRDDLSCTVVHDPDLYEPYFYCEKDKIWCGYDDEDSIYIKARYAKNLGLAGVVAWTMDEDDFHPTCYEDAFHLINTIKKALDKPAGGDVIDCDATRPAKQINNE